MKITVWNTLLLMLTIGMCIGNCGMRRARREYSIEHPIYDLHAQEPFGSINYMWPWTYMFGLEEGTEHYRDDSWNNKMYYYYWAWTWSVVTVTAWIIAIRQATKHISRRVNDGR